MKKNASVLRTTKLTLAAVGFMIASGPVVAQEVREIIVEAPYVVHEKVGRTSSGATVELVTLTRRVSYADLNLAMQADVATLNQRIDDTAKSSCKQLDSLYPLEPKDPACAKKAVDGAKAQVEAAIAAASGVKSQ